MLNSIRNATVKVRLSAFISVLLILIFLTGVLGLNVLLSSNKTMSKVVKQHVLPLNELWTVESIIRSGVVQPVDRLLFEQITWEECQQQTDKSKKLLNEHWQNFFKYYSPNVEENETDIRKTQLNEINNLVTKTQDILDTLSIIIKNKGTEQLDSYTDSKIYPLAESYSINIDNLSQTILSQIEVEYDNSQKLYNKTKTTFIWTIIFCVLLSIFLGYFLIKSINTPLKEISKAMTDLMKGDLSGRITSECNDEFGVLINGFNQMTRFLSDLISEIEHSGIQVTSSITEIASTIKQQEATVTEHAATSNEIAASTTQIAATGNNLLDTMTNVAKMTQKTATAAAEGHHRLTKINDIMASMDKSTSAIVAKLSVLGEKTTSITNVTQTINKIADQTNLLSLNAAIEAEKAGEYGTGFSVVSSEIRRLADQTAVATYDIEQMAEEVRTAIDSGMISIENFAEDVKKSVAEIKISSKYIIQVVDKVQDLESPIDSLQEGIAAQTLGAEQISESINQLNDAAQQTAESMSQTSNTIFQLNKAALILRDGVDRFTLKTAKKSE